MKLENIQRIVLTLEDLKKAKVKPGLRIEVPTNTTEILVFFEGPAGGNGEGSSAERNHGTNHNGAA